MVTILHITSRDAWETAVPHGQYHAPSLESEGFIHCSTPAQVVEVANAVYAGQQGLVLLVIEPDRVRAEIVYEDCYQSGQTFPHIYGPLNVDAVVQVLDFPPDANGRFSLASGDWGVMAGG